MKKNSMPDNSKKSTPKMLLTRILAFSGVILLAALYLSTIFCALTASEHFMDALMASLYATVIIPVLIWAFTLVYRLVTNSDASGSEGH